MAGTIIERMGAWAAGLKFRDIPPGVVEKIRLQILTSVTAAAASPWHEPSLAVGKARESKGDALVFATKRRLASRDAAFVNTAFAMSLDYDDYMLTGHTGYSAVLVPLAYARTIEEVITAAAVANETMGRLSTNGFIGPLNGQMSSYIHNLGAAVSLGKVLNLSAVQMSHAMAIALSQPNYSLVPAFWNAGSKTITASTPCDQGMQAALLAASGLTGPLDILDHKQGVASVFSFANYPGLYDGLGVTWFSETLCYKRYPGTSYISAAVEGALKVMNDNKLKFSDIQFVNIKTTVLSYQLDQLGLQAMNRRPMDANAVNFSLRLSVAAALRFGDLTPEVLRPEALMREEEPIREIARRITVAHDWGQTVRMIACSPPGVSMFSRLTIRQWMKLAGHFRKLRSGTGNRIGLAALLAFAVHLPKLVKLLIKGRKKPVSALELDTASFRMFQSAQVTVGAGHVERTETVEVPWGACGRDLQETRDLVRRRCEQAFGSQGNGVWKAVFDDLGTVEELNKAASAQRENPV